MSLFSSLNTARGGLAATGSRAQTASSNIANVSTPAYVRRETVLSQNGQNGVTVTSVTRSQDQVLVNARRIAQAQTTQSEILQSTLSRTLSAFGEPGLETGIFGSFSRFEGDLQTLRNTPGSEAAQSVTVDSLRDLTQSLSTTAANLQTERTRADTNLTTEIEIFNSLAEDLFDLNVSIQTSASRGLDTSPLLDQRDQLLDRMNESLSIQTNFDDAGAVTVRTQNGLTIVGARVSTIEFTPSNQIGATDVTTEQGGRLSVPTLSGQPLGIDSGVYSLKDGRIAAYLDLRDSTLPAQAASLDQFAYDLANAMSSIGEPLLLDNSAAIDPLNIVGMAERLTLNPRIDPAQGGLPSRLRDGVAAVTTGGISDDTRLSQLTAAIAPFSERLATVISDASSTAFRAERIHAGNLAREVTMTEAELQQSAVDLDFELQSLIAIEQAYNANARVIQTVSDMLETLARL